MNEENKALSCPFCGGKSHHILGARQIRMLDVVNCLDCFAEIQGTYEPESALTKWNTRAQLPSKGGEAVATDAFVPGSLADLLFQLGEKGIGVSGGTHGDHWAVALPGASVSVPVKSCAEQVEILAHLYMGAFSAGELGEIDIDLVTPNAERLQQELVLG